MNKRLKSLALSVLGVVAGFWLAVPHSAAAWSMFSLQDIGFQAIQYVAYGVSYLVGILFYIIFAIEAFFLQYVIEMNMTIVNSPGAQFGFSIVLAFANILFVAAIIVMAVATIVRYDTYGAKQILWKIVIAAIGVNFSLILAGTVISFADEGTKFFMNNAVSNPSSSQGPGAGTFIDVLAGTFNPQRAMIASGITTSTDASTIFTTAATGAASQYAGMFAAIIGVGMAAMMGVLMAIFFGVLLAAFLSRYIMLTMLLIIMPAVWLAWIFPFGKGLVSYWRDKFIKWTFFAPMAMFFLYLSMTIAKFNNSAHLLGENGPGAIAGTAEGAKTVSGFIYKTFAAFAGPLMTQALDFALVIGTLYGGLYFSSKMGIKAAGAGQKAFESIGNSVKRRVTQRAKDTGAGAWDKFRTGGKDKQGNSRGQRLASRLNSLVDPKSKAANALLSATGIKGGVKAVARGIADGSVADKKAREERAMRYKADNANFTGTEIKRQMDRNLSGSLHLNSEAEWGLAENMIDSKQMASFHEHAYKVNEKGETIRDANGQPVAIDPTREKELKDFMKRATDGGFADKILKANPLMAEFAPAGETEKRDKDGNVMRDPTTGKTMKRNVTKAEALFNAIKGMKGEDIGDMASKNVDLLGNADPKKAPSERQIMAVKGLGSRVNKIEDPEALLRIHNTLQWLYEQKEASASGSVSEEAKFLFEAPVDGAEGDFSSGGLGFSDRDFNSFKPVVKQLDKNTAIAPILLEVLEQKDKKEKKEKREEDRRATEEDSRARRKEKTEKAKAKARGRRRVA